MPTDEDNNRCRWGREEKRDVDLPRDSSICHPMKMVDFIGGFPCSDAYAAVGILKTRYRLADVQIRKSNPTRIVSKSSWETPGTVSRLYDRSKQEYFGSNQLKEITKQIEIKDRQLNIILRKILAEEEKAKGNTDDKVKPAAAGDVEEPLTRGGVKWVVPELNFFAPSIPGASYNLETLPKDIEAVKKSANDKVPPSVPEIKKRRSLLRRAINGLRKSFSRKSKSKA